MPTLPRALVCIDSTLLYGVYAKYERPAVEGLDALTDAFRSHGLIPIDGPDLAGHSYETSYRWEAIAEHSCEVLHFEGHGSVSRGLRALHLEGIAASEREQPGSVSRLDASLLIFGSCYTGISELPSALPYLISKPVVVVASDYEVKFEAGSAEYPALVSAWSEARILPGAHARAARMREELRGARPDSVFTATAIEPIWPS